MDERCSQLSQGSLPLLKVGLVLCFSESDLSLSCWWGWYVAPTVQAGKLALQSRVTPQNHTQLAIVALQCFSFAYIWVQAG